MQKLWAYGDGSASVEDWLASNDSFSAVHSNASHHVLTQMLSHLQHNPDRIVLQLQSRQNRRQSGLESDVHDGSDDLAHLSDRALSCVLIGDLSGGSRRAIGGGRGRRRRRRL